LPRIALAQFDTKVGDKEHNFSRMKEYAEKAREQGADLIIFPELSLTGYVCRDLYYELAELIPGPTTHRMVDLARSLGIYIIYGMVERSSASASILYNTAVLVGPEGLVGKYRKMHLPTHSVFEEKRYFRPGYDAPVYETDVGRIGMMICYDIFFPEVARLLRIRGAELLVCISASPGVRRHFFEGFTVARAMENTAYLAYVNLVGIEDGLQFWGGSRLVSPTGSVIAQAKYDEEDMVVAEVDYGRAHRAGIFVPTLRDLRPELYDMLGEEILYI